ncbi:MAG: tRNA lysidine(34) synthetase TilS [Saprospiraceae bacterium]|nr:tRNA lysidine(34) synthetase TilS [Saprospiraceae bacterium]
MALLVQFKAFVHSNQLIPGPTTTTLLAVSGGLDSVVMAHLFQQAGWPFVIAHCNFQLRGADSDEDAAFVQHLAETLAVPFFVKRFETSSYAAQNGLSTQVAARDLRYEWFAEICEKEGFKQVATAHHLNDSVETLVLHFVRSTGIKGMRGIPAQNVQVIRPLLFATREEINDFAMAHNIAWREDSSNASDDYTRNFIRHRIMPLMQEINPDFLHSAQKMMARMGELDDINTYFIDNWLRENSRREPDGTLRLALSDLEGLPHTGHFLFLFLGKMGFSAEQCRQLGEGLQQQPGREITSDHYRALVDRKDLIISPLVPKQPEVSVQEDDLMVTLPDGARLMLMPAAPAPPYPDGREAIMADADKLVFPLLLRGWQAGDVFQPFGMGGQSQKLQDYFTNLKLSRLEKDRQWLLLNGDGAVIWVVGHRLDERFKIRSDDANGLKISYLH